MKRSTLVLTVLAFLGAGTLLGCGGSRNTASLSGADDPSVVAVIGNEPLTLHEFEERYARTVGGRELAAADSLEAYEDFLQRYVNFRLKVRAAAERGLDQDPQVLDEISTYRQNLARPYLIEREVMDPLVRDLYARRQEILDVSHILIRVDRQATPSDTLEAHQTLSAIRDSIAAGADFGVLAERHSQDPSAARPGTGFQGRIGYFLAGRMVDEFEDVAYATPPGSLSDVFRTDFGYHILQVEDRRPAVAPIDISHIMIVPSSQAAEDSAAAYETIAEIKARLDDGEDFAALAREHSMDRRSAAQGGALGEVGFASGLPEAFRDAAYALEEVGDVSDVVATTFGLHLITLNGRGAIPTYDEAYDDLKKVVTQGARAKKAEEAFARTLWSSHGGTVDTATILRVVEMHSLDTLGAQFAEDRLPPDVASLVVAELGDSTYTLADFLGYAGTTRIAASEDQDHAVRTLLDAYASSAALEYETAALEKRDPEFGRIMTEFREGLILFRLMEDSVWAAAAEDSVGLRAHFEERRDQYSYPERTRVLAFYSASDAQLQDLVSGLEAGQDPADLAQRLLADTTAAARVDTVRIADPTNSIFDQALTLEQGEHLGPMRHNRQWLVLLNDGVETPRLKQFEEARAAVISEYQDALEEALIARLRERYGVRVFPERLVEAYQESPTEQDHTASLR